jgi:Ca2+-binding EF-hand superfamily protein
MMGLVAHPGMVSGIAVASDSGYLFSSGGPDLSINMWQVDLSPFEGAINSLVNMRPSDVQRFEMAPFYAMLEGGTEGELYNDIVDYFYFCQVRTQGEATMDDRLVTGTIAIEQIPYLMRAIGFYPTEDEIINMVNEIRYAEFMKTGVLLTTISLHDFIKLYLNHRPVLPLNNQHIDFAFDELRKQFGIPETNPIKWTEIQRYICSEGEVLSTEDLDSCLTALLGSEHTQMLKATEMTSGQFAEKVLGFEDTGGGENGDTR